MKHKKTTSIQQLDDTLRPFSSLAARTKPSGGWIRAIREALGMTNRQLAERLRRKPQTLLVLQKREAVESIQLNSLREIAEAMDCELVYALVPRKPLHQLIRERAEMVARRTLRRTEYSMQLEGQGLGVREKERALEREIESLLSGSRRRLWE